MLEAALGKCDCNTGRAGKANDFHLAMPHIQGIPKSNFDWRRFNSTRTYREYIHFIATGTAGS